MKDKAKKPMSFIPSVRSSALLLLIVLLRGTSALGTTLSEWRQLIVDARPTVSSARFVYTEIFDDDRPATSRSRTRTSPEVQEIRTHTHSHVVSSVDLGAHRQRIARTDLRDIDRLLADYSLPERDRDNIDMTRVYVRQDDRQMSYANRKKSQVGPHLILSSLRARGKLSEARHLDAGIVFSERLSAEWNPVIEEIREGGEKSS